ncbi:glycine cleavage system aminomethyltransferase GcvT [Caulobacter sp. 17J65-9]|uniref:glycine cleavage system aminomethyltransferase GcvT n=1 Tax=Caulobacter sp. 17J65-9 TaxID=2709382 RepID=UPI0013C940E6|nr:glycine cleavage system aminomethyltransferase GcvT [Caulobacter sp. 17J65-9]NEX93407.1 glycine cleavage system aminomethyltransferase GcvT [Caulobacter sp. 17J65-9]
MTEATMKRTPLYAAHVALGARMVPFAGYEMPVQYEGVLAEHRWTREHAGLFDVSHMGQAKLRGAAPLASFEKLVPGDYIGLKEGKQRYSVLLSPEGGMLDDLMAGRPDGDGLYVVVNAACKDADFALIESELGAEATLERLEDRALLAIQGPEAVDVMVKHEPKLAELGFMECGVFDLFGAKCFVSRSGYTGEDGYEISIPADKAEAAWNALLADARVKAIGLGARDSLRLEAGLPLYGHDADETTSPVEAALTFALSKRRKEARDFKGAERIMAELGGAASRVRVGLSVLEGAPAREGAEIADADGKVVGKVTSGGPSPTLGRNIAMGYVPPSLSALGTRLNVIVRGKSQAAEVVATPFVAQRYFRKTATA